MIKKLRLILKMEEFLSRTSALDNREKGVFVLIQLFMLRKGATSSVSVDIKELFLFLTDGKSFKQILKSIDNINSKVEGLDIEIKGSVANITDNVVKKEDKKKLYDSKYYKSSRNNNKRVYKKVDKSDLPINDQSSADSKRRFKMFSKLQKSYHPSRSNSSSEKARDIYCTKLIEASDIAKTDKEKIELEDLYHKNTLDYIFSMRKTKEWQDGGRFLKGIYKLVLKSPWEQTNNNSIDPTENGARLSQLRALDDMFSGDQ